MKPAEASNAEMQNTDATRILWSGGWDSTFRLLQLLLIRRRRVQPYYIIDPDRLSTRCEIQAMRNIKTRLFMRHAETREILLPTQFGEVNDIAPNHEITEAFAKIREYAQLGDQYDWFARFVLQLGLKGTELCVHRDDRAHRVLSSFVQELEAGNELTYIIRDDVRGTPEYALFRFFTFPVFHITKLDMQGTAAEAGFRDLMELTWFCHRPRPNGTPCGICNPCIFAIEEGQSRRVPFSSRLRYHLSLTRRIRGFPRDLVPHRVRRILVERKDG